jgi:lipid-A-disaccharide synthase-like uncharacterized protein
VTYWFHLPWYEYLGIVAAIIFFGRFYLQWLVSERAGQSVIPVGFWYMSCTGSLMLLVYAALLGSPVGALSHCFNIVVYARNLYHIWGEKGWMTRGRALVIHAGVVLILLGAAGLTLYTWSNEIALSRESTASEIRQTWFWIAVGALGQGLFACRFIVQWLATERTRKSVVPVSFWYLSLFASFLLMASHMHRQEWVFAAGIASTLLIYARNLWLIKRSDTPGPAVAG